MADKLMVERNETSYEYEVRSNNDDGKVWHLYSVTLWDIIEGVWCTPVMVMADSPETAIGQAICNTKLDMAGEKSKVTWVQCSLCKTRSRAERVPFRIQGWSANEF